jgi:hypothetical protein
MGDVASFRRSIDTSGVTSMRSSQRHGNLFSSFDLRFSAPTSTFFTVNGRRTETERTANETTETSSSGGCRLRAHLVGRWATKAQMSEELFRAQSNFLPAKGSLPYGRE